MRHILVTNKNDGMTYRNVFCLICNFGYDTGAEISFWNSTLRCDLKGASTGLLTSHSESLSSFLSNETISCALINHPPAFVYQERKDHPNNVLHYCYGSKMIDNCDDGWKWKTDFATSTRVFKLCKTVLAPVMKARQTLNTGLKVSLYRNKYCAQCNDINPSQVFCLKRFVNPLSQDDQRQKQLFWNSPIAKVSLPFGP